LIRHIPLLEDHGSLYMYYGVPYSEECVVHGEDEEDNNLILSYECEDLCNAIAEKFAMNLNGMMF